MKEQVWVVNKDTETYTETFNGDPIIIKPNGRLKMSRQEAKRFLGAFGGNHAAPDPRAGQMKTKNLEIEKIGDTADTPKFVSNIDGKEFETQTDLDEHLKKYEGKTVDKDEIARRVAGR